MKKSTFTLTGNHAMKTKSVNWDNLSDKAKKDIFAYTETLVKLARIAKKAKNDTAKKQAEISDINALVHKELRPITEEELSKIAQCEKDIVAIAEKSKKDKKACNDKISKIFDSFADWKVLGLSDRKNGDDLSLYDGYKMMVNENKNGVFRSGLVAMLKEMGVVPKSENSNGGNSEIVDLTNHFIHKLGGKVRSNASIEADSVSVKVVAKSEAQFRRDFMAVLSDIIASNVEVTGVSAIMSIPKTEEEKEAEALAEELKAKNPKNKKSSKKSDKK